MNTTLDRFLEMYLRSCAVSDIRIKRAERERIETLLYEREQALHEEYSLDEEQFDRLLELTDDYLFNEEAYDALVDFASMHRNLDRLPAE